MKTFTDADAGSGLDQARQLITEVVMDSQHFIFDHMLLLPAVKALTGEPTHKVECDVTALSEECVSLFSAPP